MTGSAKNRIYIATIAVLSLVIAAMVYKFIVAGSTQMGEDGRVAIILASSERALMLSEMRGFVSGLQHITDALSREDAKGVAQAAREMGTAGSHDVPLAMMARLPLEFKTLALGVHRGFDALAVHAEADGKATHTLNQLSGILQKCVACHASYEIKDTRIP